MSAWWRWKSRICNWGVAENYLSLFSLVAKVSFGNLVKSPEERCNDCQSYFVPVRSRLGNLPGKDLAVIIGKPQNVFVSC